MELVTELATEFALGAAVVVGLMRMEQALKTALRLTKSETG